MDKWIVNIILGALITLAVLTIVQLGYNYYAGVWML